MCMDVIINDFNLQSINLIEFLPLHLVNVIKFKHSSQSMTLHFMICKKTKNGKEVCMWCAGFCFDYSKLVSLCVNKDTIQNYFNILKKYACSECDELMFYKQPINDGCTDITCFNS